MIKNLIKILYEKPIAKIIILMLIISSIHNLFFWESPLFDFLDQYITILIPTVIYVILLNIYNKDFSFKKFFKLNSISKKTVILIFFIAIFSEPISYALTHLTTWVIDSWEFYGFQKYTEIEVDLVYTEYSFFISLMLGSIMPAINEEILFRGAILSFSEEKKWSLGRIIFLNAILFGLFHENLYQFFYTALFGTIVTYVVIITDSLYSGIFFHFISNSFSDFAELNPVTSYYYFDYEVNFLSKEIYIILIFSIIILYFLLKKLKAYCSKV